VYVAALPALPSALRCGPSIENACFEHVVRSMALEHHKWDAQVGDVAALAAFPIVLSRDAWRELAAVATSLAAETVAMEDEIARRPQLHTHLGVPAALSRALTAWGDERRAAPAPRIMRFDFHPTPGGWRISEVNSDVPGGFTESSRFAALVADATRAGVVPGDAADAWCRAIARVASDDGEVALLSAPGWIEDAQVVAHLASRLRAMGLRAHLAQPQHLRWAAGRASLESDFARAPLDAIVRFYQAEWIVRLPTREAWVPLLGGTRTPVTNPGAAALTESKRLPLLWDELDAPSTTWRRTLPETRDPRGARGLLRGDWVLKPAYGNTGDDVTVRTAVSPGSWARCALSALARPSRWVAQRRFAVTSLDTPRGPLHPCIGVYVVDGRAAGAYGRLALGAVVDYAAIDAAVLVDEEG
jgi:hypothetical protein